MNKHDSISNHKLLLTARNSVYSALLENLKTWINCLAGLRPYKIRSFQVINFNFQCLPN